MAERGAAVAEIAESDLRPVILRDFQACAVPLAVTLLATVSDLCFHLWPRVKTPCAALCA